jgi:hypothetical protein
MTDLKSQRAASLKEWLTGGKAPTQFTPPKRAKLVRTRADLPQFQKVNKGPYF